MYDVYLATVMARGLISADAYNSPKNSLVMADKFDVLGSVTGSNSLAARKPLIPEPELLPRVMSRCRTSDYAYNTGLNIILTLHYAVAVAERCRVQVHCGQG